MSTSTLRCEIFAARQAETRFVSCRLSEELLAHSERFFTATQSPHSPWLLPRHTWPDKPEQGGG